MRKAWTEPDVAHSVTEYQTQFGDARRGLGIGLLPRLGRGVLPDGVAVVPLRPAPVRRLYAVWRTAAARRPAIAATVAVLGAGWTSRDTT